jgi:hypothetical protein
MSKLQNFVNGMVICQKYLTDETTAGVFEVNDRPSFSVSELKCFSKEDLEKLKSLGWNAGSHDYGWAEFSNLDYIVL